MGFPIMRAEKSAYSGGSVTQMLPCLLKLLYSLFAKFAAVGQPKNGFALIDVQVLANKVHGSASFSRARRHVKHDPAVFFQNSVCLHECITLMHVQSMYSMNLMLCFWHVNNWGLFLRCLYCVGKGAGHVGSDSICSWRLMVRNPTFPTRVRRANPLGTFDLILGGAGYRNVAQNTM